jgi:lipoprotein-releasing system permease protein
VPGLAAAAWNVLSGAGGALALTFIVALALAIGALTLFFFGSSVVVLQGFARRARRVGPVAAAVVLLALVAGALAASSEALREVLDPSVSPLVLFGSYSLAALIGIAALAGASHLVLGRLAPDTLVRGSLLVLGAGYALVVGGSARLAYAAAPAGACGLAALAARAVRRRRGGGPGEVEPAMRDLAGVLALGAALAIALPHPSEALAAAGGLVLQLFFLAVVLGLLPLAAGGFVDTRQSAEWFIAVRYLVAKRRQTFISIISLICAGGVAAGVWLIITVLSVMNGFQQVWREEIVGKRAHLTVQSRQGSFGDWREVLDRVLAEPEVVGAAPYLDAEGMVRGGRGQIVGVRIRGVDPARVGQVTTLAQDLIEGDLADLAAPAAPAPPADGDGDAPAEPALPGIAIGSELAFGFGLAVGDPILLVSPFGGPPTPFGPAPRLHRFRVAAIFRSTFFQAEEMVTYVSLPAAQEFLRSDGDVINGIEVRVRDVYRSRRVALSLQAGLGDPFHARDWKEFFPAFFQALKTEQVMMFVLLTMIMVVAAFVIVATLIMMIMEKSSDIAILKAMGAEDAAVERIFAIEGTLIGLAGTAVGVVAGIVVTTQLPWIQRQVEAVTGIDTLPASVYQFSTLPWRIDPLQVIGVAAIAMVLALGATLLPSRQGARLDPAESLRYE